MAYPQKCHIGLISSPFLRPIFLAGRYYWLKVYFQLTYDFIHSLLLLCTELKKKSKRGSQASLFNIAANILFAFTCFLESRHCEQHYLHIFFKAAFRTHKNVLPLFK